jgi:HEAT repeat protein
MTDRSIESLRQGLLAEPDPPKRMDLVESLVDGIGNLPGDLVETLLVQVLRHDENCIVRHEAAFVLGRLYGRGGIPGRMAWDALAASATSDPSLIVRHEATESLGWFSVPQTTLLLKQLELDPNEEISATAKLGLLRLKGETS